MSRTAFRSVKSDYRPLSGMSVGNGTDYRLLDGSKTAVSGERIAVPRLLVCVQEDAAAAQVEAYARYLRDLLAGQITRWQLPPKDGLAQVKAAARHYDLVIFEEGEQSLPERLFSGRPGCKAVAQLPASILVARQPRWPIYNILLIARAEETDEAAAEWVGRLARASSATVTVLVIVPSLPAMYSQSHFVQPGLDVLLAPNTHSGQQLRHMAEQFAQWRIAGTLHLRQDEPHRQIEKEVSAGNYDLLVIAAESQGRLQRLLLGELVHPLLKWIDRPVLVAKPAQVQGGKERRSK